MPRQLGDQDILRDMLGYEKYISRCYHNAVLECANEDIRRTFMMIHEDEMNHAKMVFDAMYERGWVRPEEAVPAHAVPGQAPAWQSRPPEMHMRPH